MKKKFIAVFLLICLVLNITGAVAMAEGLRDSKGHWAQPQIEKWINSGVISGYPDGSFKPDNSITRAEFVTMINKAFNKSNPNASANFTDLKSSDWYYQAIASGVDAGYIVGYSDGTFKPNQAISRQETALIITRLTNLKPNSLDSINFKDAGKVAFWARESIIAVVAKKIMKGYADNTFQPEKSITRAEALVVLDRAKSLELTTPSNVGSGGGGGGGGTADNSPPTIQISSPTNQPSFETRNTKISLAGVASDNSGSVTVTYTVYQGVTDQPVTGSANWSITDLDLLPGENVITVTAKDPAGNKTSAAITINYDMGRVEPLNPDDVVTDPATQQQVVNNQILITFKDNVSEETVNSKVYAINGEIIGYLSGLNEYQVRINSNPTLEELKALIILLNEDEAVEVATLNTMVGTTQEIPNDPAWFGNSESDTWDENDPAGDNWRLEAIKAPSAWDYNDEMQKVKIGIMDGGFNLNHVDLQIPQDNANGTFGRLQSISSDFTEEDKYIGANDHGTHVAGIIGAIPNNQTGITGVIWDPDLYVYRVQLNYSVFEYKYALLWLLEKGSKVINMSIGNEKPENFDEALIEKENETWTPFLKKLINHNYDFIIVQSAGNESIDAKWNGFFTAIDDLVVRDRIIISGAIKKNLIFQGYSMSNYSNYGSYVDILAPGGGDTIPTIFSTVFNGYARMSGTSQAAPHVAGVAGLVWSINPDLTAPQVKQIVLGTADRPITKAGRQYNILNAQAAVERARSTEATTPIQQPVNGVIMGKVIDAQTGAGIEGAEFSVFKGSNYEQYFASTVTAADGSYELILAPGDYKIFISKENYLSTYSYRTISEGIVFYEASINAVSSDAVGLGRVSGYISNAFTGQGVNNLNINFRAGLNNVSGDIYLSTTTINDQGYYQHDLPAGNYTAEISGEGFATGYMYVVSLGNTHRPTQNGTVTPIIPDDQTRVVLTWGQTPADLDSHLTGPAAEDDRFHIFYADQEYTVDGEVYADLDLDDTTSYGPETTTIYQQTDGVYRFSIHDYTNRNSSNSTAMSLSGAKVEVYRGSNLVATFNVPNNQEGVIWTVFELNGNTITPINQMSNDYEQMDISQPDLGAAGVEGSALQQSAAPERINLPPKK